MSRRGVLCRWVVSLGALVVAGQGCAAQPPPGQLLVLLKGGPPEPTWAGGGALAFVDPVSGKEVGRVPTGENAHEITVSDDGKLAFLTAGVINGTDAGRRRFMYVIDLAARKELRRVDVGPLEITNRLTFPTRSRPDGMAWVAMR